MDPLLVDINAEARYDRTIPYKILSAIALFQRTNEKKYLRQLKLASESKEYSRVVSRQDEFGAKFLSSMMPALIEKLKDGKKLDWADFEMDYFECSADVLIDRRKCETKDKKDPRPQKPRAQQLN